MQVPFKKYAKEDLLESFNLRLPWKQEVKDIYTLSQFFN